jgi:hypothetical protein
MSISEELHPGLKEAGIRVTVDSSGVEAIAGLFRDLASVKHSNRENRASQLCETSLAAELLDRNLGRLAVKPLEAGATTLWIGLPIADPVEILHRHLARFTERRPGPQSVSFIRASICEPVDKELSRDVCSLLNSCIDRGDLAVELDRTRWLMAVFHRQVRTEAFQRRIERRRAAVNRKRLGRPLPQVSLRRLGTWNLPNDITQILAMVVSRVEQCAPADACAE